jgi:hypothetical protein
VRGTLCAIFAHNSSRARYLRRGERDLRGERERDLRAGDDLRAGERFREDLRGGEADLRRVAGDRDALRPAERDRDLDFLAGGERLCRRSRDEGRLSRAARERELDRERRGGLRRVAGDGDRRRGLLLLDALRPSAGRDLSAAGAGAAAAGASFLWCFFLWLFFLRAPPGQRRQRPQAPQGTQSAPREPTDLDLDFFFFAFFFFSAELAEEALRLTEMSESLSLDVLETSSSPVTCPPPSQPIGTSRWAHAPGGAPRPSSASWCRG